MADSQEAIRRLTITSTNDGSIPKTTNDLNALAKAQDGVAVASSTTEKATLSLDKQFSNIERRYVSSVRAQQDYAKVQKQVNAAVAQNPALQDRANAILAAAKDRHDQLTNSQKALSIVSHDLNSRIQASAGSFGAIGQAISALGPTGLATAAALGTLAAAFYAASAGAHELAQKARELKDFSESTGLTTTQVQALRSEATKFGVDSDTLQSGLQKFTTGFQELRLGSGDLLTQIRRVNPALADQMAVATNTADAFTLYAKAVQQTSNIFERNALARAGLGKGGPTVAEFLGNVGDVNALSQAYESAGKGLQRNMIDKLAELDLQIAKTTGKAKENFETIFSQPVLEAELKFAQGFLQISEIAKNFTISDNLKMLLSLSLKNLPVLGPVIGIASQVAGALTTPSASLSGEAGRGGMNRGTGTVSTGMIGPAAPTQEFQLAALQKQMQFLGDAATAAEKYKLKSDELALALRNGEVSQTNYNRALSAAGLDAAISVQSAHNSALGAAASATDVLKLKTLELAKAQQQGAGLTQEQIENQKRLAVENALGITQIKASADAYRIEGQMIGMTTGEAVAFNAVQSQINQARRDGRELTQDRIDQITREAQAMGRVAQATENTRFAYDTFKSTFVEFGQSIRNGATAFESLKAAGVSALGKIADKLMSMAADNLWTAAFGGSSGMGGILGAVFGGGAAGTGGGFAMSSGLGAGTGGMSFPMFANGTDSAPGGWSIVGERGPELMNVPKGAQILPSGRMPSNDNGGRSVTNNVYNNDFRGVDSSMKAYIDAKLKVMQQQTLQATPGYTAKVSRDRPSMRGRGG